jgi:hypothetical protein
VLDRTGTTSIKAVGVVASILKADKVNGKQVDLPEFKLSQKTSERKRGNNRSVLTD